MILRISALALLASSLLFSGCATKSESEDMPTLADIADSGDTSAIGGHLRSGDSIELRLGGVPREEIDQVAGTYTIDTQGFVNVPSVGRVEAAGLSQQDLQASIEEKYREKGVYSNPTVTVMIPLTARFVNVGGEVRLPQRVAYTPDLTVLAAVTAAGGFTEYASQSRVRLYRGLETKTISMKRIRQDPGNDIPLQPGDTIEVMRSFF